MKLLSKLKDFMEDENPSETEPLPMPVISITETQIPKILISLKEFHQMWENHIQTSLKTEPVELTPNYANYCRKSPYFWHQNHELRKLQLDELDMLETHEIDYYQQTKQPMFW
jgi:hypothetical protein